MSVMIIKWQRMMCLIDPMDERTIFYLVCDERIYFIYFKFHGIEDSCCIRKNKGLKVKQGSSCYINGGGVHLENKDGTQHLYCIDTMGEKVWIYYIWFWVMADQDNGRNNILYIVSDFTKSIMYSCNSDEV